MSVSLSCTHSDKSLHLVGAGNCVALTKTARSAYLTGFFNTVILNFMAYCSILIGLKTQYKNVETLKMHSKHAAVNLAFSLRRHYFYSICVLCLEPCLCTCVCVCAFVVSPQGCRMPDCLLWRAPALCYPEQSLRRDFPLALAQCSLKAAPLPERSTWPPGWWEPAAVTGRREGTHCSGSTGDAVNIRVEGVLGEAHAETHRCVRTRGMHTNRSLRLNRSRGCDGSVGPLHCRAAVAKLPNSKRQQLQSSAGEPR